MKHFANLIYLPGVVFLLCSACNDPSFVGADVVAEDQLNISFTDTVTILTTTIEANPALVYNTNEINEVFDQPDNFLVGNFVDPIIGLTKAEAYAQLRRNSVINPHLDASDVVLDSFVLAITYDSLGMYGNIDQTFDLEVYRVEQDIDPEAVYYTDETFASGMLIGSKSFIPNLSRTTVTNFTNDTIPVDSVNGQIRIPIDLSIANEIKADSNLILTDSAFQAYFKGLHFKMASETDGMLSFHLHSANTKLSLYYTVDGVAKEYSFYISESFASSVNFRHDFSGSIAAPFINGDGDSLLFLQAASGLDIKVELPHITALSDIAAVNGAELELTVAILPESNTAIYPLAEQLIIYTQDENGEVENVFDLANILGNNGALMRQDITVFDRYFGGVLVEEDVDGTTLLKYKMNISKHVQDMISGDADNTFYISAGSLDGLYDILIGNPERVNHSVLYGAKHSQYPVKLNLTYTSL